jgi:hypothetical protein
MIPYSKAEKAWLQDSFIPPFMLPFYLTGLYGSEYHILIKGLIHEAGFLVI